MAKTQDMDELISDFSRFYSLTILYEGPVHGYSSISQFKQCVKKKSAPASSTPS